MGEVGEGWRVSVVLRDPLREQRVAAWEQAYATTLTPGQRRVLTQIATAVQDSEVEQSLDGDRPLEEISQDDQAWSEFIADCKAVKERYTKLMAEAVRNGLFAYPQYCRQYCRNRRDKVRFVVLNAAHPLVLEWVGKRRAVGDRKALHHYFWRTNPALYRGVQQPRLRRKGEVPLAEEVLQRRHNGQRWRTIFRVLSTKGLLLRNKKKKMTQNTWQTLYKWAIDNDLVEAKSCELSQREAHEIQQREAHEIQQRAEIIRTLELTPQSGGGYLARVHIADENQIEVQERDGIGALIALTQSCWYRYPGEQQQQDSDT